MSKSQNPHDDSSIRLARKRRERELREEQRSEWDRFERLTHSLVQIPKHDLDEKRKSA